MFIYGFVITDNTPVLLLVQVYMLSVKPLKIAITYCYFQTKLNYGWLKYTKHMTHNRVGKFTLSYKNACVGFSNPADCRVFERLRRVIRRGYQQALNELTD